MDLLLTSAGIKNPSIRGALLDLLGRPVSEASARCIPTAGPMTELGWKSLGVLELTALPSVRREKWTAAVREADALLVYRDVLYLNRWMRESGLADLPPSLRETICVGVSAGSMVTAPVFGETYDDPEMSSVTERGSGLVDFALLPHLDHEDHPESSAARVGRTA